MSVQPVTDWPGRLRALVFQQFQQSNWAVPTAEAIGAGAAELDAVFVGMLALLSIDPITDDSASPVYGVGRGVQLDRIGRIVGQARGGLADDDYRPALRARILANRSHGSPNEILAILVAMFDGEGSPSYLWGWIAAYTVRLVDVLTPPLWLPVILDLVGSATQAGVYAVVEWTTVAPESVLTLDGLLPGQALGDENDPSVGGLLGGAAAAT